MQIKILGWSCNGRKLATGEFTNAYFPWGAMVDGLICMELVYTYFHLAWLYSMRLMSVSGLEVAYELLIGCKLLSRQRCWQNCGRPGTGECKRHELLSCRTQDPLMKPSGHGVSTRPAR